MSANLLAARERIGQALRFCLSDLAAKKRNELTPFHCPTPPVLPNERIAHRGLLHCGISDLVWSAWGPGCAKTKSDLVAMPSAGRIFAFFCSERDHKPQNSRCSHTAQRFYTAWVMNRRTRRDQFSSAAPSIADDLLHRSERPLRPVISEAGELRTYPVSFD
jgi:hypothetical protein